MATMASTGQSKTKDSYHCGKEAAMIAKYRMKADGKEIQPHIAIVFASTQYQYSEVLRGIRDIVGDVKLIGCSTAGEFSDQIVSDASVVLMLIHSDEMKFITGLGRNLRADPYGAVRSACSSFAGRKNIIAYPRETIFLLSDGMAGNGEALVENVSIEAGFDASIAGGAAGDGGEFKKTFLFHGQEVCSDALSVVQILSKAPIGIGVAHGWCPSKFSRKATKAQGNTLFELDGKPAFKIYEEYAEATGFSLTRSNSDMFMMTNELGIHISGGDVKIRAPIKRQADDSIVLAAEIPEGATVSVVEGKCESLLQASKTAAENAMRGLGGGKPAAVIVFDCIARKINLGADFVKEVDMVKSVVGEVPLIGFNTYGEIARVAGQLSGFHNTTDVVCIIPA